MVQREWRELLERSVQENVAGAHWLAWYHLGVTRYRAGDRHGAREAWQRSLSQEVSPWACRDLAVLMQEEGDLHGAADLWLTAAKLAPKLVPLAVECTRALLRADRAREAIRFVDSLGAEIASHGRIRLLRAVAALAEDDLDTVARYFDGEPDFANIREKETTLSDLWFGWHERRLARERGLEVDEPLRRLVRREFPPPARFDFRLNAEVD